MPTFQLQFHAAPDEAVAIALAWALDHGLLAVFEQFFPIYRVTPVDASEFTDPSKRMGQVNRVALCQTDPDVTANSAHAFVTRNPNCLFVSIGTRSEHGLRESALAGVTEDRATNRLWRELFGTAESSMHVGARVRNPLSGATANLPRHRHTTGAHQLADEGVRMLASAGWNELEFDDRVPKT